MLYNQPIIILQLVFILNNMCVIFIIIIKGTVHLHLCITHLKACKQELAKNNSRTKHRNLDKFTSWLKFSHISLREKNDYKMILIILKKVESSKKAWEELGTQIGVYANSVYSWLRLRQSAWLFSFPPSNIAPGAAVTMAFQ